MKPKMEGSAFSDERRDSRKKMYRVGVGCDVSAQSDALRVCGDAAHPARHEIRPALDGPSKIACSVPPPTTVRRGVAIFSRQAARTSFGTGKPAREPEVPPLHFVCGDHGKGGLVGRSLLEGL